MINIEDILNAHYSKSAVIFKNAFTDTVSWEDLLNVLSKKLEDDMALGAITDDMLSAENLEHNYSKMSQQVRFWNRLIFTLKHVDKDPNVSNVDELFPEATYVGEEIGKFYNGDKPQNCFAVISLMKDNGSVGLKHSDPIDQFQWQSAGLSKWYVGKNLENEYVLYPGDIIFIPANVSHKIESLTPRFAFTYGVDNLISNEFYERNGKPA
jgi:ribosomal protein L16 Arg81 hydroxylase